MDVFNDFLATMDHPEQRARMGAVLAWVQHSFPQLAPKIAWKQPMFTDHGTFIIGFSVARHHMAVAPESAALRHVGEAISLAGYASSANLIRLPWSAPVDFPLLENLIAFNIRDKADCASFWRTVPGSPITDETSCTQFISDGK